MRGLKMSSNVFKEVVQNPHFQEVQDVTPEQVKNALNEIVIIDVRENAEWNDELGHIESAKLINLGSLPDHLSDVPNNKTVVFVCKSGGRSARAAAFIQQQGLTNVFNMKGGMLSWNQLGLPISQK